MLIGHIKEIVRHPVKSFHGENVNQTKIMEYGLYGDRSHAFLDDTRQGKFLTITQFPEMVRYRAKFVGEELMEKYPKVEITTPEGKVIDWGDEELTKEIEYKSERKISPITYTPSHVPLGAIEEENIQLVTDASLDKLTAIWGNAEVNHRRFRPNLLITLREKIPFIEEKWFGKRMKIGREVEIQLKRHCERCMIITVDPDNTERDSTLLKTVVKERNNHFGVYASVVKTGEIHVGDEVLLIG
ncbi:MOSC domain-containing protein [Bacillus sp. Xin]|uniref:MOSC domain-containing protein n=1 Tax=unclassified Bacillus (in: firmicutes) TaxID=185979 RepID=UPI001571AA7D|nr:MULTISPECIES: MOSC N-terminal beta barrel domain-containing protein [unclassified Bacillus (in: firmicutes)]MBC6972423.1 MOSC domain-containing protein [Bacillus sp. Xin]NSW39583.1 MOSC domain-containing protein [Bacillus sp. Xin1]